LQVIATISFEQFKAAVLATRRQYAQQGKTSKWIRIVVQLVIWLSITLAIHALTRSFRASDVSPFGESFTTFSTYLRDFGFAFLLGTLLLICRWWSDSRLRKIYEIQKEQLNGQIMNIDESGISGQWENGDATYQYRWSAFEGFVDLPDEFLFFPNAALFVRIPKDSLSGEDQQTAHRWAQAPSQMWLAI
jgi:hypothetical protein